MKSEPNYILDRQNKQYICHSQHNEQWRKYTQSYARIKQKK
jgi:hypothetical protein